MKNITINKRLPNSSSLNKDFKNRRNYVSQPNQTNKKPNFNSFALKNLLLHGQKRELKLKRIGYKLAKQLQEINFVADVSFKKMRKTADLVSLSKTSNQNTLLFKIKDNAFGFNLLRNFLSFPSVEGIAFHADKGKEEFTIIIENEDERLVFDFFTRIFNQLTEELNYKAFLSEQIQVEKKIFQAYGRKLFYK